MDLPKRKSIRLKDYDYSSNGAYFITVCTKNREKILCNISVGDGAHDVPMAGDISLQLTNIGKIVEKYILSAKNMKGVNIDNYIIMPDHIHLLLRINNPDYCGTSRAPSPTNFLVPRAVSVMKRLINKEVGENIFQRSYHDHIIRTENDYLDAWSYIDSNPRLWLEGKDNH
ncbi:MAG: transposase [Clostridia bacterium]|nr:transposase [Clostridia bacterium]